jgi:hypothetical protein
MHRSSYYRAQADHARLLADITVQDNLEEVLRRVAERFDQLADQIAAAESGSTDPEKRNTRH